MSSKKFRHSAGFGKRIEYYIISLMLKEGLDVFIPMVDDDAVDAVVKRPNGEYVEIQIKARSKECEVENCAAFSAISHKHRENYYFVFYSELLDTILILSSSEFMQEATQNNAGENAGKWSIWFNRQSKKAEIKEKYKKYIAQDFSRILNEDPNKDGEI